jgi:hypothetical protein
MTSLRTITPVAAKNAAYVSKMSDDIGVTGWWSQILAVEFERGGVQ